VKVQSWGLLSNEEHLVELIDLNFKHSGKPGIPMGLGRSYGDAALNPEGAIWQTRALNHFIAFDEERGELECEAGISLREIQALLIPRGWNLPVTPGTQFVTVGGAIANDIHGKSHHTYGTFGDQVISLTLRRTDGSELLCSPEQNSELFAATIGGIGLTGLITKARLALIPCTSEWIEMESSAFNNLSEFFALSNNSVTGWESSVAWVDCVGAKAGRGIFMRGNPAAKADTKKVTERQFGLPFTPPISLVNKATLRALNTGYFQINRAKAGHSTIHYRSYFYPLDAVANWNRIYGPKGFYQYQSVIPHERAETATKEMMATIAASGEGSFLAVLKVFGDKTPRGLLSFPMPGVTLALDFPNRGAKTLELFAKLDEIVIRSGGRLYLAKDARMSRDMFETTYPRFAEFNRYRDPGISSAMSRRLLGA
jgi:FAD/FMN-containing dehydrogenase